MRAIWPVIQGDKKVYLLLNLIFALIVILVFIYFTVFTAEDCNYPLPSFSAMLSGEDTISTGLSRSFSELMRLNFKSAADYNPYGFRIWLFFVIQLAIRVASSGFVIFRKQINIKLLIITDSLQLSVMFIISFLPFLTYFFKATGF